MKKVLLIIGLSVLTVGLAIGGYGFYIYKSMQSAVDSMHQPIDRTKSDKREVAVDIDSQEPLAFLLMGVDERGADKGRTDTIIVITVNPEEESMKMVSIPRDTYTEIVGRGTMDKINHAYAFGGPEMAINTVENFFDIPLDYFVTINMEGFKEIVDVLGGVSVESEMAFSYGGYDFDEGILELDGEAALAYSRMRYEDPRGDLGRNDRQRQIIDAIIKEGAQFSTITKADDILDSLGKNVATNLTFDEMMKIQSNYAKARHNSETLEFSGNGGGKKDGIWYLFVPEEEREHVSHELRVHLGIEDSSEVAAAEE
ncbi:cell envelope-related function transcriptional attenuator common domain-containing protein [Evansella caseinilytica]|uniref:Polyisoprenyl-teichoic acid--peptidoglycan teichoic acid transferase TagU n=1 Tax=Evansella caseinilytica TaxID=1503961 RepID=A0A1H3T917_9BACI|nr:LCP family protein [Evansella caseinilytica]SDZ46447.1 cell envelope-related function transcriptional attenuator common domain-containing protein [Evansella caseinilytica]